MQQQIKNITFIIPSLTAGGAERVISFVANSINKQKFNVTLVVIGSQKDTKYKVENIRTIYFEKERVIYGFFKVIKYLRDSKPDLVLSAISNLNAMVGFISILFPKITFVAREVNVLSLLESLHFKPHNFRLWVEKKRFKFFDKIVCQSLDMRYDLMENYNVDPNRLVVINNPISDSFELKKSNKNLEDKLRFITVARLDKEKGHDRILKALAQLNVKFSYIMIGTGVLETQISNLISELNLASKTEIIPYTDQVHKYLEESDLYLQGSYVEGFPNAVLESCAVGTPVLAYRAPGGIEEIIVDGVNGKIVDAEEAFINHIQEINQYYNYDPTNVSESVIKRYSKEKIISQYENLFLNLIG